MIELVIFFGVVTLAELVYIVFTGLKGRRGEEDE